MELDGDTQPVLLLGRALHRPWNEGTRVIGWNFARSLEAAHDVAIVSLTHQSFGTMTDPLMPVSHVYTSAPYGVKGDYVALPRVAAQARRLLRRPEKSRVHIAGLPLALAPLLRGRSKSVVAHVVMTRQKYQGRVEQLRASLAWRLFNSAVDAYACSSRHIRDTLVQQGYPQHKLYFVPPAIDTKRYQRQDRAFARHALKLDPKAFLVVYVGTVSPLRFPAEKLMQALQQAAPAVPNIALTVFAPVSTHSYNIRWSQDNVRHAAEGSPIPVDVRLADLSEDEKALAYSAADMVLLPFTAPVAVEPPLTLLEAMACEAICMAAPHANRSAIVDDGHNGYVYHSVEQLAAQLEAVAQMSPAQRARVGDLARACIEEHYSFAATRDATERMWASIDNRARPLAAHTTIEK